MVKETHRATGASQSHRPCSSADTYRSPSGKTPEELALENENLRASLDTIAQRAHEVDLENQTLRSEAEERAKAMKTIISEVRREVSPESNREHIADE